MKRPAATSRRKVVLYLLLMGLLAASSLWLAPGCTRDDQGRTGSSTASTEPEGPRSGDIEGRVGETIRVGQATVTVRALQSTFQPATPEQRLSEQTPTAPGPGETFYQAYVRVANTDVPPLRIEPDHFVCAVGQALVSIEPTRSGPYPRSLLKNTSLDLLLTFKAAAGYSPVLIYNPPWYRGVVTVRAQEE